MRTTLNLDDQLLTYAKHQAVEERISLAHVIENALRESLAKPRAKRETIRLGDASGMGGVKYALHLEGTVQCQMTPEGDCMNHPVPLPAAAWLLGSGLLGFKKRGQNPYNFSIY